MDDNNDIKQQDTAEETPQESAGKLTKDVEEKVEETPQETPVMAGKAEEKEMEAPQKAPTEKTSGEEKHLKEKASKGKMADETKGKWYIVHTYSGHENKVAKTLMQRVGAMGFEDRIFDAIVPTRETIRIRAGKKENVKEKIFPGYILVRMDLTDESWILVRTTPGVTSFVGAENKPTPIRDDEVAAILQFVGRKEPVYKAQFSIGEAVKINDGPFSDFLGTVESIDQEKGKVKVLVSIFGRETPVELDFLQVTKI